MPAPPLKLPMPAYEPDKPDYPADGSSNIRNVYPRTAGSYGPVASPSVYSANALTARCQGAVAVIDSGGNVFLFAGDSQDLYDLRSGSSSWTNVSKSSHAYGIGSDAQWQYTYFNGDILATDFVDNIQAFTLASSSAFADLAGTPPKARYIATIKNNFVVLGNTFDGTNGNMPQRVWWCAAGNHKSWPTPGTTAAAIVQSGAADLLGDAGWVQGFAVDLANADGVVFMERAVKRMMYAGPPIFFAFLPAENVRGTPAPYSIVVNAGLAYYLGQDGFYATDGVQSQPIGANKIDRTFWADVDMSYLARIVGTSDPVNKLIIWAYPGAGSSGGVPNRVLLYNWSLERWSICDITCETICRMLSIGYTLDQLFTVLGYTLDNLPAPLDSRIWTGGRLTLGTFDTNHKLNYLSGNNLAPRIDTSEMQPFPGQRALIKSARVLVDAGTPSVSIGRRERLQDAITWTDAVAMNSMGSCPVRTSGRYLRASITLPSNTNFTHIAGIELEGTPQGYR